MAQQTIQNTQDVTITLDPIDTVQTHLEYEIKGYQDNTFAVEDPSNNGCVTASIGAVSAGTATLTVSGVSAGCAKVIVKSKDDITKTVELNVEVGKKVTNISLAENNIKVTTV